MKAWPHSVHCVHFSKGSIYAEGGVMAGKSKREFLWDIFLDGLRFFTPPTGAGKFLRTSLVSEFAGKQFSEKHPNEIAGLVFAVCAACRLVQECAFSGADVAPTKCPQCRCVFSRKNYFQPVYSYNRRDDLPEVSREIKRL